MRPTDVRVAGAASAEELAGVLVALATRAGEDSAQPSPYERWRAGRLAALRRTSKPR